MAEAEAGAEVAQAAAALKDRGETVLRLDLIETLPEEKSDAVSLRVPAEIMPQLVGLDVEVATPFGALLLPAALVETLAAAGQDISLTLEAGSKENLEKELRSGQQLVGEPVEITSSLEGEIRVTLTTDLALPTDPAEREAFLATLSVIALHGTDSENLPLLEWEIDEASGQLKSFTFIATRFSTFALLRGPSETELWTKIGSLNYSVGLENKVFDRQTTYRFSDGVTVIAVRLLEELGAEVDYEKEENVGVVTVSHGDVVAVLKEGDLSMQVTEGEESREVVLRANFTNNHGRTYLPTRDILENLHFFVHWNAADDSIVVSPK